MTIVMIQGPAEDGHAGLPADTVRAALNARARSAGQELVHYRCADAGQLVERLARIDSGSTDLILLDPGSARPDPQVLTPTLAHLQVPYIEIHADSHDRPASVLPAANACVAVVNGYAAQSYTLAMSIALEQLGCAECENEFNVGT